MLCIVGAKGLGGRLVSTLSRALGADRDSGQRCSTWLGTASALMGGGHLSMRMSLIVRGVRDLLVVGDVGHSRLWR